MSAKAQGGAELREDGWIVWSKILRGLQLGYRQFGLAPAQINHAQVFADGGIIRGKDA